MSYLKNIFVYLINNNQTISCAESCTGGGLTNSITNISGSSKIFLGGIICYANSAKINILKIPDKILIKHGAVSEPVALHMAQSSANLFKSSWGVSTTGVSGPTGGSIEKPVGSVWIGIYGPKTHFAQKFVFKNISRQQHKEQSINQAWKLLASSLTNSK